jgi:hypothetical protein
MKRNEVRIEKKLMVNLSDDGFDSLGLTNNLSRHGLCVNSGTAFPGQKELELSIAVPGGVFDLKGEVMWCKDSGDNESNTPESLGIRITHAPPGYLNYVEYIEHIY